MPAYEVHPETEYYPDIPHGTIKDTSFFSTNLNNSRIVKVYLPAGYGNKKREYPVILFHDGHEYISLSKANNILDYLIAHQVIQPVIGIFVPPVNRTEEYNGNLKEQFTSFIVDELMPVMDQKYRTSKDPQKRTTLGASSGGNISLYIGMKHPEVFGKIAAQSSSVENIVSDTYQNSAKMNLELYLDIGSYDIPVLITWVNNLVNILQYKEYTFLFRTWHEGHSWGNWRDHLYLPLKQFFPFQVGINENRINEKILLRQNYPNPFSSSTKIDFMAPAGSNAELSIFDLEGKRVTTVYKGLLVAESNTVECNRDLIGNGIYVYSLKVDQYFVSRKMNIINK